MISPNDFQTRSLKESEHGMQICRILASAINAVDPYAAVLSTLRREKDDLCINGVHYDLGLYRRIIPIGFGKACVPMLRGISEALADRIQPGIGITKDGYVSGEEVKEFLERGIQIYEAGHPLPDERGIRATREIARMINECQANDLVIVAISGGGSALFTDPYASISLPDLEGLNLALLKSGATIQEINTIRKHIDRVKGGGLARLAYPATMITLILSDVVGDALEIIASGPSVPDLSTLNDAYEILRNIPAQYPIPDSILGYIQDGAAGRMTDNPKPGAHIFEKVQNVLVGSNRIAARAALEQAQREGFSTLLLTTFLQGEAFEAGSWMGAIAREVAQSGQPLCRPACIVSGGETTVTIGGDGMGGRNQEMALGAVNIMDGLENVFVITLATDGGDGNTDAAGAVVTGETQKRAISLGMNVGNFHKRNDSYHFFHALEDIIRPGPTQTNVNDLSFIIAPE